jgi:protein SERAC1
MAAFIKRYGISEVYPGDDPGADLVLVHGLNGHPRNTWAAVGSNAFWPHDLLPETIPRRVRILTYGYNATASDLLGDTSSDQIHHHAQTLVQELFANRSVSAIGPRVLAGTD